MEMFLIIAGFLIARAVHVAWNRSVNNLHGEPVRQVAPRARGADARIVYYRTRNGRADYKFRIEGAGDGGYRAYILEQPGYNSLGMDNHATHRLSDSRGYFVCWTKRLDSPEEARQVAALWADRTEDYIVYGRRF